MSSDQSVWRRILDSLKEHLLATGIAAVLGLFASILFFLIPYCQSLPNFDLSVASITVVRQDSTTVPELTLTLEIENKSTRVHSIGLTSIQYLGGSKPLLYRFKSGEGAISVPAGTRLTDTVGGKDLVFDTLLAIPVRPQRLSFVLAWECMADTSELRLSEPSVTKCTFLQLPDANDVIYDTGTTAIEMQYFRDDETQVLKVITSTLTAPFVDFDARLDGYSITIDSSAFAPRFGGIFLSVEEIPRVSRDTPRYLWPFDQDSEYEIARAMRKTLGFDPRGFAEFIHIEYGPSRNESEVPVYEIRLRESQYIVARDTGCAQVLGLKRLLSASGYRARLIAGAFSPTMDKIRQDVPDSLPHWTVSPDSIVEFVQKFNETIAAGGLIVVEFDGGDRVVDSQFIDLLLATDTLEVLSFVQPSPPGYNPYRWTSFVGVARLIFCCQNDTAYLERASDSLGRQGTALMFESRPYKGVTGQLK